MATTTLPKLLSNIYKLDNYFYEGCDFEEYIIDLVNDFSSDSNHHTYSLLNLKNEYLSLKKFKAMLFISQDEDRKPDWLEFVNDIIAEEEEKETKHLTRKYPSFLIFFYNNFSIYCVAKGAGHYVIKEQIVPDFGIQVLECLLDDKQTELRRASERGVIGPVLQRSRFFRGKYNITDERSIGMYYKDIDAFIDKDKLKKYLNFTTDKAALVIGGKDSLEINTALNINELYQRISKIEELLILKKQGKFKELNKFKRVSNSILNRKKNKLSPSIIERLEEEIVESIHNKLKDDTFDLEIYHPNMIRFSEESSFTFISSLKLEVEPIVLDTSWRITLKRVLEELNLKTSEMSKRDFSKVIYSIIGYFGKGDDIEEGKSLITWINYDTILDGTKYFYLDGAWFTFVEDFKKQTSNDLKNLLNKLDSQPEILKNWELIKKLDGKLSVSEEKYNLSYRDEDNLVVCDRALLNNIEICDFFEVDGDKIILYHVKNGLGTSTRVVYNQIMNGAILLNNLRLSNKKDEIDKYFSAIKSKNYVGKQIKRSLIDKLLIAKNIEFCLVYATKSDKNREEELNDTQSFIAKLSILQCEHDLRTNFDFKFNLAKVQLINP